MWLVSSMIISIIKFRFHVQSTAQLNYLLSTIVYLLQSAKSATLISSGRMSDYYIKEGLFRHPCG